VHFFAYAYLVSWVPIRNGIEVLVYYVCCESRLPFCLISVDVIKDNVEKGSQLAEKSGNTAVTFSDFFKSMKSKIVDLDEVVVKCEPKKKSMSKIPKFGFDPAADPVFGLCMINPLLSSQTIQDRMIGKIPVPVSQVKNHLKSADNSDWVVAGVLVNKSLPKTSQKGIYYLF